MHKYAIIYSGINNLKHIKVLSYENIKKENHSAQAWNTYYFVGCRGTHFLFTTQYPIL